MSNLTIGLAAIGGLGLAAIIAQGAWAARKADPKRPAMLAPAPREPALAAVDGEASDGEMLPLEGADGPDLKASDVALQPVAAASLRRAATSSADRIDPMIDAVAKLSLEAPMSGDLALAHLPTVRRAGRKPVLYEGRGVQSDVFEPLHEGERYAELQVAVQLANRSGPLNAIEYSEFVQHVQVYADAVGAMADVPDMLDAVARARELDAFAGACDAQLAVHLQAQGSAWSAAYVHQQSAALGFVLGVVPGRLLLPGGEAGAPPLLALTYDAQATFDDAAAAAAIRDITLHFDVPQTAASADPFALWRRRAEQLATAMDAALVDDAGQPLRADGFDLIAAELGSLYARLEAHHVAAGSAAARRLFS